MADVLSTFAATALATFVPLYIGLFFPTLFSKGSSGSLFFVAASVGIISWFFLDVAGDAAQLDVNQGFGGGYTHVVLAGSSAFVLLGSSGAVYIDCNLIAEFFGGGARFSTLVFTLIGLYSMYTAGLFHALIH